MEYEKKKRRTLRKEERLSFLIWTKAQRKAKLQILHANQFGSKSKSY